MLSALIRSTHSYPAFQLVPELVDQRCVQPGPLVANIRLSDVAPPEQIMQYIKVLKSREFEARIRCCAKLCTASEEQRRNRDDFKTLPVRQFLFAGCVVHRSHIVRYARSSRLAIKQKLLLLMIA